MTNAHDALVTVTRTGLYCAAGDFYIDPWGSTQRALITHAHSDHARSGSAQYFAAEPNQGLLRKRLGQDIALHSLPYGEQFTLGGVRVSFHPAGHVLGSAQIRIESERDVWVVSGDYKRDADPTCAPFEVVPCDVFISEATFALPIYRWPAPKDVARDIHTWWMANREAGLTSVLLCYALGKAQRVLAELQSFTDETIYVHGAVQSLVEVYRDQGISLAPTMPVGDLQRGARNQELRGALVVAPPGASGSPWMRRFEPYATGFCSGWMRVRGARRRGGYDRGFVLSDHADWPSLLATARATKARRILLTHGYSDAMVRYLQEQGLDAAALKTEYGGEE